MKICRRVLAANRKSSLNVFAMRMYETSDRGHKFSGGLNYLATYSASSLELVCHEFETLHAVA